MTLPQFVQTLIIGGGVAGASAAYHLGKFGRKDVLLIERNQITSGTTWHAAGLIMQLRSTHAMTDLARYNVELYSSLEAETGQATGFKQNGTLGVARTTDRLFETKRLASIAKSFGIEAEMISPSEAKKIYSGINEKLIEGAIFVPKDGQTNPVDTTMSLIAGAKRYGVKVKEFTTVNALERRSNGNYRVTTNHGIIETETLVLACGLWTRDLAAKLGLNIPLYPCEHFYVVTEPMSMVRSNLPVLRDTDGHVYIKEDAGKLLIGAFEPTGKALPMSKLPADTAFIELGEDWEHFALPYGKAAELLPDLETAGIAKFFNGPESFTPDLHFMLGEAPGLPNCFISAGYNSEGIEFGAGAGRALAEWIIQGSPTMDLSHVDVSRFARFHNNRKYLHDRVSEVLGLHYKMNWPNQQPTTSRDVRKSVLHDRWQNLNASFGEGQGWERPMWFAPKGASTENVYSHARSNWFEHTAAECKAAREGVIVIDQSSFGKHLVLGRDACRGLQRLCAGDIDVPVGKLVYTHMLNEHGGIETDITVNRLAEDRFLIISSATTHARDKVWIERHISRDAFVTLSDVTGAYAVLSVQGPKSRALLERVSGADLSNEVFAFATSQEIEIGYAHVIANRLTFVGELGWELHIPAEFAQSVFDFLLEAGAEFNLKPMGYHALEHLRSERAYREYQLDLTPEDTLYEAGLGFTVALDKPGGFIGRNALARQKQSGALKKRLVNFKLKDPEPVLFREEPIWVKSKIVGYTSSGAYGFTLGASVAMGYVRNPEGVTKEFIEGNEFEIELAGQRYFAEASLAAFYDPKGLRVKM